MKKFALVLALVLLPFIAIFGILVTAPAVTLESISLDLPVDLAGRIQDTIFIETIVPAHAQAFAFSNTLPSWGGIDNIVLNIMDNAIHNAGEVTSTLLH